MDVKDVLGELNQSAYRMIDALSVDKEQLEFHKPYLSSFDTVHGSVSGYQTDLIKLLESTQSALVRECNKVIDITSRRETEFLAADERWYNNNIVKLCQKIKYIKDQYMDAIELVVTTAKLRRVMAQVDSENADDCEDI